MIPFHAIWGLCWYNFYFDRIDVDVPVNNKQNPCWGTWQGFRWLPRRAAWFCTNFQGGENGRCKSSIRAWAALKHVETALEKIHQETKLYMSWMAQMYDVNATGNDGQWAQGAHALVLWSHSLEICRSCGGADSLNSRWAVWSMNCKRFSVTFSSPGECSATLVVLSLWSQQQWSQACVCSFCSSLRASKRLSAFRSS